MNRLIVASNNEDKIKEMRRILKDFEILSLKDIGLLDDIVEDGNTFEENALIKARATYEFLSNRAWVLSDDSGLCVNALGGAPGIYSARYAGNHDFMANRAKLLEDMKDKKDRSAYFYCAMALISPDGEEKLFFGKSEGEILFEETGKNGFGYDCLFFSKDLKKSFGICNKEEKDSVSHRGRALEKVAKYLKENSDE